MMKIEKVMMTRVMPIAPRILAQVGRPQQRPTYDMQHTQLLNIVRVTIIPVFCVRKRREVKRKDIFYGILDVTVEAT